jgi:hypothetical protein
MGASRWDYCSTSVGFAKGVFGDARGEVVSRRGYLVLRACGDAKTGLGVAGKSGEWQVIHLGSGLGIGPPPASPALVSARRAGRVRIIVEVPGASPVPGTLTGPFTGSSEGSVAGKSLLDAAQNIQAGLGDGKGRGVDLLATGWAGE